MRLTYVSANSLLDPPRNPKRARMLQKRARSLNCIRRTRARTPANNEHVMTSRSGRAQTIQDYNARVPNGRAGEPEAFTIYVSTHESTPHLHDSFRLPLSIAASCLCNRKRKCHTCRCDHYMYRQHPHNQCYKYCTKVIFAWRIENVAC